MFFKQVFLNISSFARFFPQQQQLDSLLEQEDCSLETILSAEGILQEIRGAGSNKFADYLIKFPDMYQRMINYVIQFEDELIDKKSQIQFPFLSSEILGSQNQRLIDYLFERPEEGITLENENIRVTLFDQLVGFLDNDVLNYTSAGYFAKVFCAIIKLRGYDVWTAIQNNDQILSRLIQHIDIKPITETLDKLIILDTNQEYNEKNFLYERRSLLQRIINLLQNKSYCNDIVDNICDILCEICEKSISSLYYQNPEIAPFINQINRPELFFDLALRTQRLGPAQVLIYLVDLLSKKEKKEENNEEPQDENSETQIVQRNFQYFENILPDLPSNLVNKNFRSQQFLNTNQQVIKPYGLARMKLLNLITVLVQTKEINVIDTLLEAGLIQALKQLCIQYSSNNQIHCSTLKIIETIIDIDVEELTEKVICRNDLLQYIIDYHTPVNRKLGFIGFLTSLSNYLIEKSRINNQVRDILDEDDKWQAFTNEILAEINCKEKQFLCNVDPRQKTEILDNENSEADIMQILSKFKDSAMQQQSQENADQQEGHDQDKIDNQEYEGSEEYEFEYVNHLSYQDDQKLSHETQAKHDREENIFNNSMFWKIEFNEKMTQQVLENYE